MDDLFQYYVGRLLQKYAPNNPKTAHIRVRAERPILHLAKRGNDPVFSLKPDVTITLFSGMSDPPWEDLWVELKDYLNHLFDNLTITIPDALQDPPPLGGTIHSQLLRLLVEWVNAPIHEMQILAREIIPRLWPDPSLESALWDSLEDTGPRYGILATIKFLNDQRDMALDEEALRDLTSHTFFTTQVLHLLPPTPPASEVNREFVTTRSGPLPSIRNHQYPRKRDFLVGRFLRLLEPLTEVSTETLERVLLSIVYESHPEVLTDDTLQENTNEHLQAIGLRIITRHPLINSIRHAFFILISELYTNGYFQTPLQEEEIQVIAHFLYNYDPHLVGLVPSFRPSFVIKMEENSRDTLPDSYSPLTIPWDEYNSYVVLGELSELRMGYWNPVTEHRQRLLKLPSPDPLASFATVPDYWDSPSEAIPLTLLVSNPAASCAETRVSRWLAINPRVARDLGWVPSAEGCFRWVDPADPTQAIVESIWWVDGFMPLLPTLSDAGEGWYVRASSTAWETIRQHFPEILYEVDIQRFSHSGERPRGFYHQILIQ